MNVSMLALHLLLAVTLGAGCGVVAALTARSLKSSGNRYRTLGAGLSATLVTLLITATWFSLDPIKSDHVFSWRFWHPDLGGLPFFLFLFGPGGLLIGYLLGTVATARACYAPVTAVIVGCAIGFFAMWHEKHEQTPAGVESWVSIKAHRGNNYDWWKTDEGHAFEEFVRNWCGPHLEFDYAFDKENPPTPYVVIAKDYSNGRERVAEGLSITLHAPFTYAQIKDAVWQVASDRSAPSPTPASPPSK